HLDPGRGLSRGLCGGGALFPRWRSCADRPISRTRLPSAPRAAGPGSPAAAFPLLRREPLQRFLESDLAGILAFGHRGAHCAVLHVGSVAPIVEAHRLLVVRMAAQLTDRGG